MTQRTQRTQREVIEALCALEAPQQLDSRSLASFVAKRRELVNELTRAPPGVLDEARQTAARALLLRADEVVTRARQGQEEIRREIERAQQAQQRLKQRIPARADRGRHVDQKA